MIRHHEITGEKSDRMFPDFRFNSWEIQNVGFPIMFGYICTYKIGLSVCLKIRYPKIVCVCSLALPKIVCFVITLSSLKPKCIKMLGLGIYPVFAQTHVPYKRCMAKHHLEMRWDKPTMPWQNHMENGSSNHRHRRNLKDHFRSLQL